MNLVCLTTDFNFLIPIFSGIVGWIANVIWERSKYKREQKTYYWKEKINAGKKATEFYIEYINLLNLLRLQANLYKNKKIKINDLLDKIRHEQMTFQSEKLINFPHYEHHHINLFYKLIEDKNFNKVQESKISLEKIQELVNSENYKEDDIILLFEKIIQNYNELYEDAIFKLNYIREDLTNNVSQQFFK